MAVDLEQIIIELVVNGGNARSLAMKAITAAQEKNYELAATNIKECNEALNRAHGFQTEMLQAEARQSGQTQVSLIMVHGQDHLMNAITVRDLAIHSGRIEWIGLVVWHSSYRCKLYALSYFICKRRSQPGTGRHRESNAPDRQYRYSTDAGSNWYDWRFRFNDRVCTKPAFGFPFFPNESYVKSIVHSLII